MWTILRVKKSRGLSHRETPQSCEFHLQKLDQVLTGNIGEKSPHASARGRRKASILKCDCRSFLHTHTTKFYHHITKGLLTAIPFTQYIMSINKKKINSYTKRKKTKQKHSLELPVQIAE